MGEKHARVLLIAEFERDLAVLREHLESQGCRCEFAPSYSEGVRLVESGRFDLVLSNGQPGIRALLPALVGSSASLFCGHAIEDGCLWIPVVIEGKDRFGDPPLRPKEFSDTLRQIVSGRNVPLKRGLPAPALSDSETSHMSAQGSK